MRTTRVSKPIHAELSVTNIPNEGLRGAIGGGRREKIKKNRDNSLEIRCRQSNVYFVSPDDPTSLHIVNCISQLGSW